MTHSTESSPTAKGSPLGKDTRYGGDYDPSLLFAVPRHEARSSLGLTEALPFFGEDRWNAYEISWLNERGKPQVAIGVFRVPCDSPFLIESKSFKLYLNSCNDVRCESRATLRARLAQDLSAVAGAPITVQLFSPSEWSQLSIGTAQGICLDDLDISCDAAEISPDLLGSGDGTVTQVFYTDLFKSNCLITGQPDWATVQVAYTGPKIDPEGLLKYLVSYRHHQGFHEQCVERIFVDLMERCQCESLCVSARFTRRGGLDINPVRSTAQEEVPLPRLARQ